MGRRVEEEIKQEVRWELLRAYTPEERVKACLHSEFCAKLQQQKKFRCDACNMKRGMTAFECPYCHLLYASSVYLRAHDVRIGSLIDIFVNPPYSIIKSASLLISQIESSW